MIAQSVLHFTPWQTYSNEHNIARIGKHLGTLQLLRRLIVQTYPPLYVVRYSFIQLSEMKQCRVNELDKSSTRASPPEMGLLTTRMV